MCRIVGRNLLQLRFITNEVFCSLLKFELLKNFIFSKCLKHEIFFILSPLKLIIFIKTRGMAIGEKIRLGMGTDGPGSRVESRTSELNVGLPRVYIQLQA